MHACSMHPVRYPAAAELVAAMQRIVSGVVNNAQLRDTARIASRLLSREPVTFEGEKFRKFHEFLQL